MEKIIKVYKRIVGNILLFLSRFLFTKDLRHKSRLAILQHFFMPTKSDFAKFKNIMNNEETIQYIIQHKCSLARYGDGEIGYLLSDDFEHFFQPYNKQLQDKLKYVLLNSIDSCLVALPIWLKGTYNYNYVKWQTAYLDKFLPYANEDIIFGSSYCFLDNNMYDNNCEFIKPIWDNRDIIFLTGKGSTFVYQDELFSNAKSYKIIETKAIDAFSEYENIIETIKKESKDTIILMALGLTATVLAYDISKLGYQAIDIGHFINSYLSSTIGIKSIDIYRLEGKYVDGVTDINDLIAEELTNLHNNK